ncbi:hypothetical protein KSP39_PZI005122 [Platanthera zijinensis]|uniref:DDE Tnp4 domain-containing protein n=1 Tax=Platanthera zijinensis TaxID=2320716 RepID=A0AAP0GAL9_9ASPA
MSKQIFCDLLILLEESYGLKGSRRTATREVLGMTLYILGHHETLRKTSERFQHSTETISRYFEKGLRALTSLSMDIICPTDPQFRHTPAHIENDDRYMPYFKEIFNQAHSSLRSVIERSFGVWKNKWRILRKMPQYSFSKQCVIVVATMALHNYIRRHPSKVDPEFRACDLDETFVHPEAYEHRAQRRGTVRVTTPRVEPVIYDGTGAPEMSALREFIAHQLENARG